MRIKNGFVFSEGDTMVRRDLCFENGVITDTSDSGEYDAEGCFVLPGFIDTHVHGVNGIDFGLENSSLTPAFDWLTEHGITSVVPTVSTRSKKSFLGALRNIISYNDDRVVGIHAEGPFLNIEYKGGMIPEEITAPDISLFDEYYDACGGSIRIITVAPEMPGAKELAKHCVSKGVAVSMGHTNATYKEAEEAEKWGFTRMTHTYNAMRPLNHREPGVLGFALDSGSINNELICDFTHVSAPAVSLVIKAKGYKNVTAISDGVTILGYADGEYEMPDGRAVVVKNGAAYIKGTNTITGSARSLADGAKNLFSIGIPPEQIAVMACVNPAKAAGCTDRGTLDKGMRADVIVLDKDFNLVKVFSKGKEIR